MKPMAYIYIYIIIIIIIIKRIQSLQSISSVEFQVVHLEFHAK